jgi:hypothetical protein
MIVFFFRQFTLAMTVAVGLLLLGEILMPGLVLPFLNLHLCVVGVLALNLMPFGDSKTRPYAVIPIGLLLIGYAFFLLSGQGPSAMLLLFAIAIFILCASVAIMYEHRTL